LTTELNSVGGRIHSQPANERPPILMKRQVCSTGAFHHAIGLLVTGIWKFC